MRGFFDFGGRALDDSPRWLPRAPVARFLFGKSNESVHFKRVFCIRVFQISGQRCYAGAPASAAAGIGRRLERCSTRHELAA